MGQIPAQFPSLPLTDAGGVVGRICEKVQVKKIYSGENWYLVHERVEKEYD